MNDIPADSVITVEIIDPCSITWVNFMSEYLVSHNLKMIYSYLKGICYIECKTKSAWTKEENISKRPDSITDKLHDCQYDKWFRCTAIPTSTNKGKFGTIWLIIWWRFKIKIKNIFWETGVFHMCGSVRWIHSPVPPQLLQHFSRLFLQ